MKKQLPIAKFLTDNGIPCYIDLREVEGVGTEDGKNITVLFKSGRTFTLNRTFLENLTKAMDEYAGGAFA